MRKGLLLIIAVAAFILFAPTAFGLALWPFGGGGGAAGTLEFFGLDGVAGLLSWAFMLIIAMMAVLAASDARGTYHFKQHVREIGLGFALPWFIIIVAFKVVTG